MSHDLEQQLCRLDSSVKASKKCHIYRNMEANECQKGKRNGYEVFKVMERLLEESRMFKITKMMNRKRLENPFYV